MHCRLTKEISQHREGSNTQPTKRSSSWNVTIELVHHWLLSMATHHHLLLFQLFGNLNVSEKRRWDYQPLTTEHTHIFGWTSRHINPGLGKEGTGSQHETDVDDGMNWVVYDTSKALGGTEIVAETTGGVGPGWPPSTHRWPHPQQIYQ